MRPLLALGVLGALVGCEELPAGDDCFSVDDAGLTVCTLTEAGASLSVDSVIWARDPYAPDFDGEHPLECADAACSVWWVPREVTGAIKVVAVYYGPPHHDPSCSYVDQAEAEATLVDAADTGLGETGEAGSLVVRLALDPFAERCD